MVKVFLNVEVAASKCSKNISDLQESLNNAIATLNSINLPFNCGELNNAKECASSANLSNNEYNSLLNSGVEFCKSNEINMVSSVSKIDNFVI